MTAPVQQTLPRCYLLPAVGTERHVAGGPHRICMITHGKSHRTERCMVRRRCADTSNPEV